MNKILVIGVIDEIIFLEIEELKDNNKNIKIVDRREWKKNENVSKNLLKKIEIFLKRNSVKIEQLKRVKVKMENTQEYTLFRIIETIARTINYCLK